MSIDLEPRKDRPAPIDNSRIGRRFVLWKEDFRLDAYKDQFGKPQTGYIVAREIPVIVTEEKAVPCMWSNNQQIGQKAIGPNGKDYTCNWTSYPDDSMTPTYYWDTVKDTDGGLWMPVDAIQAFNLKIGPHVREDGSRAIPIGAEICNEHNRAYLDACAFCSLYATRERAIKDKEEQ